MWWICYKTVNIPRIYSSLEKSSEFYCRSVAKDHKTYHNQPGETQNQINLHLEPNDLLGNNDLIISMEFLSLSHRRSSWWNVSCGEELGETAVFAGLVHKGVFTVFKLLVCNHVNSLRKNSTVLTSTMAALSCGCKPRIRSLVTWVKIYQERSS